MSVHQPVGLVSKVAVALAVPGCCYAILAVWILVQGAVGLSQNQFVGRLDELGLGSAYLAAYFSAFLWVWVGPLFIFASGIAAALATRSGTLEARRSQWMWGLVATSVGSWVFFVWHLRMQ